MAPTGNKHFMEWKLPVEISLDDIQPLGIPGGHIQFLWKQTRIHCGLPGLQNRDQQDNCS